MKNLFLLLCSAVFIFAYTQKTPSDVFSYASLLKQKIIYLREAKHITTPFPKVPIQAHKYPRHVIQKALEILSKINLYRIYNNYGEIFIPPYPTRDITPSDVYDIVKRLDSEVTPFIKDKKFLLSLKLKKFKNKTPNDVYRLLWSISLAFDDLLGIHGYTPTDVYELSQKLVQNVKFIRQTQNIYTLPKKPPLKPNLHPNHALYASYDFLSKLKKAQLNLWITPTDVPQKPHRVITPTDVYDSLQYDIAELQRIKYRLGVERYFKTQKSPTVKTPSDVVQNIRYAISLMPTFDFKKPLVQYPVKSLNKTPNNVYAVTKVILKKLKMLKTIKGIYKQAKKPPYIYGLKPIHAYQKAIEATEKAIKLKVEMGFYPSDIPSEPLRKITPNEVYEMVLRLDGIVTILLHKLGEKDIKQYIYLRDKKIPTDKVPSDVYNNLWKISNEMDIIMSKEYTPNETFALSNKIKKKVETILKFFRIKDSSMKKIQKISQNIPTKTPSDVFALTLKLFSKIKDIKDRLNMTKTQIIIPTEKNITPNTVYNSLRIINATINEILIYKNINKEQFYYDIYKTKGKTPTDVFKNVQKIYNLINLLYNEKNYEE